MLKWELNNWCYYFRNFFDFIFPRFCAACQLKLTTNENSICSNCLSLIKNIPNDFLDKEYQKKFVDEGLIDDFQSLFIFEKGKELQKIIHALKYESKIYLGQFFGTFLAKELYAKINNWKADLIIPIPLHSLKKAQRGYNQSNHIAKGIAKILNIPVENSVLKRIRYTESQTKKNLIERKVNVEGAFKVKRSKKVQNKKIILVDDVVTTGATISECARQLKKFGAKNIFAVSLAIADDYILSGAETPNIDNPFFNTI